MCVFVQSVYIYVFVWCVVVLLFAHWQMMLHFDQGMG